MDANFLRDELRIASPCPADWNRMKGDERVRFCQSCNKHVYNISSMTSDEAVELLQATEGRMCVRLYRRTDGTVLTADCPRGIAAALNQRLKRLAKVAVAVLGLSGINSFLKAKEYWPYAPLVNPLPSSNDLASEFRRFRYDWWSSLWGSPQVTVGIVARPSNPPPPVPVMPPNSPGGPGCLVGPSVASDPAQNCPAPQ